MKQSIRTAKAPVDAQVTIPGSKSVTNRALLIAALAEGVSEIFDILISADTLALVDALHNLGIIVQCDKDSCSAIVAGCQGKFPKATASVWCQDAGTIARFLLAACAATNGHYLFDGSARLRERPILPLLQTLISQGAKITPPGAEQMPFTISVENGLKGGLIEIDGKESSQFTSALLMAAPFFNQETIIDTHEVVSSPYLEMTCRVMADFGVQVRRMHQTRFSVPAPQRYAARDYHVEPDLSTASYFFAAAALTQGKVTIQAIKRAETCQGDVAFLTVLEKMGCQVEELTTGLTVQGPAELQGVSVNMSDFSDTFMTLAAMAPFAQTPTTITNIGHTRLQESNRITAMRSGLETLGVQVEEGEDWLKIFPSTPRAGVIDSHHDHRIAMAFSLIGLRVEGIEIENAACVAKTCPRFFSMWEDLTAT